ncbi:MAG: hypothetical protein L0I62_07255 [Gammaproteobacteria bacterium]|nr:hypothetical protein [Gammaproteobacteria bacterium]
MSNAAFAKVLLAAALATIIGAAPAFALEHASQLRSGELVISTPSPVVFTLPPADTQVAVLPVLFENPTPGNIQGWKSAHQELRSADESALLKPYGGQIKALSLKQDLLVLGQKVVLHVPWMQRTKEAVSMAEGFELLDAPKMRNFVSSAHVDAVAFLQPLIVFSDNFKSVYVIAPITVYAWGPVRTFFLDARTFYASTSIEDTNPELANHGMEGIAKSRLKGKSTKRARLRVWFSNGASRLKQAAALSLQKLEEPLAQFLESD